MIYFLSAILFVLSLGITAGSILISSHLIKSYKTDFLSTLLFFQVFWFTYGFYAIWGQLIIYAFMESFIEPEHLARISNISLFLGAPFLLFAWFMLMKFTRELSARNTGGSFIAMFLSLNFLLVPGTVYLLTILTSIRIIELVKYCFIVLSLLYTLIAVYTLLPSSNNQPGIRYHDLKNISFILLIIMFLQNTALFFYKGNIYTALAFIFLYDVYGGFMPVYFRYKADLSKLLMAGENNMSVERFCEKYEISKREKEVIHEICRGLSNQQIADKLFISLQTVKDHTHRIYGKTNCTSRAQLISMVNEGI